MSTVVATPGWGLGVPTALARGSWAAPTAACASSDLPRSQSGCARSSAGAFYWSFSLRRETNKNVRRKTLHLVPTDAPAVGGQVLPPGCADGAREPLCGQQRVQDRPHAEFLITRRQQKPLGDASVYNRNGGNTGAVGTNWAKRPHACVESGPRPRRTKAAAWSRLRGQWTRWKPSLGRGRTTTWGRGDTRARSSAWTLGGGHLGRLPGALLDPSSGRSVCASRQFHQTSPQSLRGPVNPHPISQCVFLFKHPPECSAAFCFHRAEVRTHHFRAGLRAGRGSAPAGGVPPSPRLSHGLFCQHRGSCSGDEHGRRQRGSSFQNMLRWKAAPMPGP